jgi:hypothetical protein
MTRHYDAMVERIFVPIDDDARDGERQLVKRDAAYAVGQWTGEFWSYPYGGEDSPFYIEQLDFEPTHYAPRPGSKARVEAEQGALA